MEYRIIEYVGAHKGRTPPATLAFTKLAGETLARLEPAQMNDSYHVRVARDGRVTAVFHDADGRQPLQEPAIEPGLKSLRFKPALEAGGPVESIGPINPRQLTTRGATNP